jgi:phospholipid N-methyltransferase
MNGTPDASLKRYGKRRPSASGFEADAIGPAHNGLQERLFFFAAFLSRPGRIGAIGPSSQALTGEMLQGFNLAKMENVVELGPGTGALTGVILSQIGAQTNFLAVELDQGCVNHLTRKFPQLSVVHDSAENLQDVLSQRGIRHVDCIISGLPWASMPATVQRPTFNAVMRSLRPGGTFRTFAFLHASWFPTANRFRRLLDDHFTSVRKSRIVWNNLPPAFVYQCVR